jgi:hypothetical protein
LLDGKKEANKCKWEGLAAGRVAVGRQKLGKNEAPRKFRARRAPCLWQGAADS